MGLHIEISGEMTPQEWRGVKALAMIMLGETAMTPVPVADVPITAPVVEAPAILPSEALISAAAAAVPTPPATVVPVAVVVPPPPVSNTAPVAPVVATPPPGVELDANGLPWDDRIHASTKVKVGADGKKVWRSKRGVDAAIVKAVTAELKAIMAAPVPAAAPVAVVPPPPADPDAPAVTDPAAAFGGAAAPIVPPPPAAEVAAAANPAPMAEFARIMRVVVEKQKTAGLATEMVTAIAVQLGLTSLRDLANRPDLIPAFEAMLP